MIGRIDTKGLWVCSFAPLPDGRLACGLDDNTIRLLDLNTGAETGRLDGGPVQQIHLYNIGDVGSLMPLPDGRLLSGFWDGTIRLWDLNTATEVNRLKGHTDRVNILTLLPDDRLVSGSSDHTIRLWDLEASREIAALEVDAGIGCLAAFPGGRLVAADGLAGLHWLEILD